MSSVLQEARRKIRESGGLLNIAQEASVDANLLQRQLKVEKIAIFAEIMKEYPNMNNKQICEQMNVSETTMRRIRKDLGVNSPYRYEIASRKNKTVGKAGRNDKKVEENLDEKPKRGRKKKLVNVKSDEPTKSIIRNRSKSNKKEEKDYGAGSGSEDTDTLIKHA